MYEVSGGREDINYVNTQIRLSLAAIHTTTESLTLAILDVCRHPEIVAPLREEIIRVVGENGWAKTTLYKLQLLDSFLKESQRMNPLSRTSMNRLVKRKTELSDGTILPKGARFLVVSSYMDPNVFPEPEKFDAYRFLNKRSEPGMQNSSQHVSLSSEHMGFGYGEHACPGRFFASNELKIALCHMLMKYDWRFIDGEVDGTINRFESSAMVAMDSQIAFRRRTEEIEL